MRWRGETEGQRDARLAQWHRVFAWLPTQMECGTWIWLSAHEAKCLRNLRGGWNWYFRPIGSDWEHPYDRPMSSPPTKPKPKD